MQLQKSLMFALFAKMTLLTMFSRPNASTASTGLVIPHSGRHCPMCRAVIPHPPNFRLAKIRWRLVHPSNPAFSGIMATLRQLADEEDYLHAYIELAEMAKRIGMLSPEIEYAYENILRLDPKQVMIRHELEQLRREKEVQRFTAALEDARVSGDIPSEIQTLAELMRMRPTYEHCLRLAQLFERVGDLDKALQYLEKADFFTMYRATRGFDILSATFISVQYKRGDVAAAKRRFFIFRSSLQRQSAQETAALERLQEVLGSEIFDAVVAPVLAGIRALGAFIDGRLDYLLFGSLTRSSLNLLPSYEIFLSTSLLFAKRSLNSMTEIMGPSIYRDQQRCVRSRSPKMHICETSLAPLQLASS
jgi:tetratricopeptide (TPR) repeat protein